MFYKSNQLKCVGKVCYLKQLYNDSFYVMNDGQLINTIEIFTSFIKQSASLPEKVVPECQGFLSGLFLPLFCED